MDFVDLKFDPFATVGKTVGKGVGTIIGKGILSITEEDKTPKTIRQSAVYDDKKKLEKYSINGTTIYEKKK